MPTVTVDPTGAFLTLQMSSGPLRFHAVWLRDNAQDHETRAQGNGQRLIALRDIPAETRIEAAEISQPGTLDVRFAPEGKRVSFDLAWLEAHAYDQTAPAQRGWLEDGVETWDADLMADVPCGDFAALAQGGRALQDWLGQIMRYGFAKVVNAPATPGTLFDIVGLFGHVRETNYGRHFEVRTEVNPSNLAFTGLGLQAHTDNPYRDPVPTVQVLHCLESSAAGGENMVVDGFAAALRLRAEDPEGFDLLANHCARFEYAGEDGVCLALRCWYFVVAMTSEPRLRHTGATHNSALSVCQIWWPGYLQSHPNDRCSATAPTAVRQRAGKSSVWPLRPSLCQPRGRSENRLGEQDAGQTLTLLCLSTWRCTIGAKCQKSGVSISGRLPASSR